jgi:hypothetical protein
MAAAADIAIVCGVFALSLLLSFFYGKNTFFMRNAKADLPQFAFAAVIGETPDATLLNYGFLDGGFYTAAGIVPGNRFFHRANFSTDRLPEMMAEQHRIVQDAEVDYVIIRMPIDRTGSDNPVLEENYEQVLSMTGQYGLNPGYRLRYALYRRRARR